MSETRALWVTRWDFTSPDDIKTIMRNAAAYHFNTVFFQVRGAGTVYFKSRYEPPAFNGSQFWDPLDVAIKAAHQHNMQLHAWVNVYPGWAGTSPPEHPGQLWNEHPDWFITDAERNPMTLNRHYVWLSPTHPDARLHLTQLFCELISRYDIDGLHFDYIRFPGPGYSYDSLSVARFKNQTIDYAGNIHELWDQYRRDGITQLVKAIYGYTREQKRNVILSSAVMRNRDIGRRLYMQDGHRWLAEGATDFLAPMLYTTNALLFENMLNDHLRNAHERYIFPGINITDGPKVEAQIMLCRSHGIPGHCLFSYEELFPGHRPNGTANYLLKSVYVEPADPAQLEWKKDHTERMVIHTVETLPDEVLGQQPFNVRCTVSNLQEKSSIYAAWSLQPDHFPIKFRRPMTRLNGNSNQFITSYPIPAFPKGSIIYMKVITADSSSVSDVIPVIVQTSQKTYQQEKLFGPLLSNAQYAVTDTLGQTWVCEQGKRQIRVFAYMGNELPFSPISIGRSPSSNFESLPKPCGLAINQYGIVHVSANSGRNAIYRYKCQTGAAASAIQLTFWPGDLDIDGQGNIFVIESDGNGWHILNSNGKELRHSPMFGAHMSQGIAVNKEGTRVYIACRAEGTVHCWQGSIIGDEAIYEQMDDLPVTDVGLGAVDVGPDGRVYVSQCDIGTISIFNKNHEFIEYLRGDDPPITAPRGVAIAPNGQYLTVAEWGIDSPLFMQRWEIRQEKEFLKTVNGNRKMENVIR